MLGLGSSLAKGGASLLTFVKDNLKLYLDFKSNKSNTLKFPSEGSTSFNGSSDKITFTRQVFSGAFTISWWFNGDTQTFYQRMFNDSSANNNILTKDANGLVAIRINGTYRANISGVPHNEWSYLTFTRDGSGNIKSYLNGVASGTSSTTDEFALDFIGEQVVCSMCNVAMWTRELSFEEVQSVMNKSYSQLGSVEKTSLVMWQSLDSQSNGLVQPATGETLGSSPLSNTDFSSNSDWALATGVTINTTLNKLEFDTTGTTYTNQAGLENSKLYKITLDAVITSGQVRLLIGSSGMTSFITNGSNTFYSFRNGNSSFYFQGLSGFIGNISNLSVLEVSSLTGLVTGTTTTTSVYGGNAPILPRAVDVAKEGQADAIGNGSALFNGSTDHVVLGGSSPDSAFSISAWVFDTHASGSDFSAIYASNQTAIWFGVKNNSSGFVRLHINGDGNYADTPSGSFSSPSNEWIHLACTWDGTNAKIYINGVSQVLSVTGTLANPTANANPEIGINDNNHSYNQWTGNISQVGIWRGALTQAQIQSVFESTSYAKIPANVKSTLSENYVTNSTFDSDISGWSQNQSDSDRTIAHATVDGRTCIDINDANTLGRFNAQFDLGTNAVDGELYKVSYFARKAQTGSTSKDFIVGIGFSNVGADAGNVDKTVAEYDTWEFQEVYIICGSANNHLQFLPTAYDNSHIGRLYLDEVKVQKVTNDLVAYYPLDESNSGSVGIATDSVGGETLGSELVTSLINNNDSWETYSHSGTTVLSATNAVGTGAEIYSNVMNLNAGDLIKVVFTITQNSGTTRLQMSDQYGNYTTGDLNEVISSSGTYTFYTVISHANMDVLKLKVETNPNDIANVTFSAKKVTSNTGVLK